MSKSTIDFSGENLKKILTIKKKPVAEVGRVLAKVKSSEDRIVDDNEGIRQLWRYMKNGKMNKEYVQAIADYLNVPSYILKPSTSPDMITEESLKRWESEKSMNDDLIGTIGGQDYLDVGIKNLFVSQGYTLTRLNDRKDKPFLFKTNDPYSPKWHITEEQYRKAIAPVIEAVKQSGEMLTELLKDVPPESTVLKSETITDDQLLKITQQLDKAGWKRKK